MDPHWLTKSTLADPLGRTLDPFLCVVYFGESVVCYDLILPLRLALSVAGIN